MDTAQYPEQCVLDGSPRYPSLLAPLEDRPRALYLRGMEFQRGERLLTVVGTRTMTSYGKTVVHMFVQELARYGFTIVSGMAMGIDGEAHRAALRCGARTIGVLASGVGFITPMQHQQLGMEILQNGGSLVSEYPGNTAPHKFQFRRRNRILAGLSMGVLVVEAGVRSGTQITAHFAVEYGRPVFAVPGPITSQYSEGTKMLVNEGARLVTSTTDILEELQIDAKKKKDLGQVVAASTPEFESPEESQVFACIRHHAMTSVDQLLIETELPLRKVQEALVLLELGGYIKQEGEVVSIQI